MVKKWLIILITIFLESIPKVIFAYDFESSGINYKIERNSITRGYYSFKDVGGYNDFGNNYENIEDDIYTIGAKDYSTGWWTQFSKYYQIPEGQKWVAQFNLSINPNNSFTYNNFALIITSDADRSTDGYHEYGAIRFDYQPSGNSEWGDYIDRSLVSSTLELDEYWDNDFYKLGGNVSLTVDRTNGGLEITMTNGKVTKTYNQTTPLANLNDDRSNTNIRAFLVPERSYIEFLGSNIEPIGGFTSKDDTPTDYSKQPFTIVAIEAGTIQFSGTSSSTIDNASIEYSTDSGNTWGTLYRNNTLSVSSGQKVYFRSSTLSPIGYVEGVGDLGIGTFSSTGRFNVEGNIMSLYYGDIFANQTSLSGKQYAFDGLLSGCTNLISAENLVLPATDLSGAHWCYSEMFYGCTSLTSAPELPATILAPYCYVGMFQGCTSLTAAPALTVTTLTSYCYARMFNGCTSLTTSPALPATTLAYGCYAEMFNGCTSLTTAPELPATTLLSECYNQMFSNCTSLATAPDLPATTLAPYCYGGMFNGCNSLTTSPALPATTLAQSCYHSMFAGCTSLRTPPALPATSLADWCYVRMFENCTSLTAAPSLPAIALMQSCYSQMFSNCTSLVTAPDLPATTLASYCYYQMFVECTSLTTAPVLPATTLVEGCYLNMFSVCTSLNYVKCLATDVSANDCTAYWLSFVPSIGTFVKASSMNNWSRDASGIPEGWTIQNDEESSTSDFSNDGLTYIVDTPSLTAEVTSYDQSKSSVTIPETVSFDGRTYRVTSIGKFAFYQCRNVLSATIPSSITSIGSSAFEDCSALTSVSLGSGLSSIGGSAFEDCTSLSAITIPATVTSIALNAFKNCSNLKNVTSEILTPFAIQDNVFEGIASGATLTVPKGTKTAYQSTTGWSLFKNITDGQTEEKDEVAFTIDGTAYQGSKAEKTAMVKSVDTSRTWMEIPASVSYDGITYQVTGIDNDVFKGGSMAALIWDVEAVLPNSALSNALIGSNFLLYVKSSSYAPSSVKNVVVDGTAQTIELSDDGGQFYCPQVFTARSISYTHNYSMETDIGKAKGWETLALPFDVQKISHNTRGEIVPFPSYNSSSTQKPFWLANFSGNGFRRTAAVLANEPYIIAMPNSSSYRNEYNLAGDVTFSSENVQVPKTPSFSGSFVPAFATVAKSSSVYALNVNNRNVKYSGSYDAGSRFISGLRDIRPFEAYLSGNFTRGIIEIGFDDDTTDMLDVLLSTDDSQEMTIHTLSGEQVTRTALRDFDAIWQQLPKGVYIVNGKKLIK